jgi:hypothetical protein
MDPVAGDRGYFAVAEVEMRFPEPAARLDRQRGCLDTELPDHGVV